MKKQIGIGLLLAFATHVQAATYHNKSTFGFIDLLSWQARESGAENWAQTFTSASNHTAAQLIDAPFPWNTGVRLGIGHTLDPAHIDVMLIYTHYQTTASNQTSGIVASAFDGAYFANNTNGANLGLTYHQANIRWQLSYNTADLNLGRVFKLIPLLQLHPFMGFKAASINQNIYTNWLNPTIPTTFTSATENLTNDFSGIGPTIGVETAWAIYTASSQALRLNGNLAAGLLWGHWHFKEVYTNNTPVTITTHVASVNGASPMASGQLGVEWSKQLAQMDIHVQVGYEAQIWFNQMQFYSLSMGRVNRPLSLQGGHVELGIQF